MRRQQQQRRRRHAWLWQQIVNRRSGTAGSDGIDGDKFDRTGGNAETAARLRESERCVGITLNCVAQQQQHEKMEGQKQQQQQQHEQLEGQQAISCRMGKKSQGTTAERSSSWSNRAAGAAAGKTRSSECSSSLIEDRAAAAAADKQQQQQHAAASNSSSNIINNNSSSCWRQLLYAFQLQPHFS